MPPVLSTPVWTREGSLQGGQSRFDRFYLFIYLFLFILRERERERERDRWGDSEREGERIPSRLCAVSTEPDMGLEPTNREIMT